MDDQIVTVVETEEAEARRKKKTEDACVRQANLRGKKKAIIEAGLTDADREAAVRLRWQSNLNRLTAKARKELDAKVDTWEFISFDLCYNGARDLRDGAAYGLTFFPERIFAEVESYAKKNPPIVDIRERSGYPYGFSSWDRLPENFDFTTPISEQAHDFREYGLPCDGIHLVLYNGYLSMFAKWYAINRNTSELSTEPATDDPDSPWIVTWDQVDALVAANKRLAEMVKL